MQFTNFFRLGLRQLIEVDIKLMRQRLLCICICFSEIVSTKLLILSKREAGSFGVGFGARIFIGILSLMRVHLIIIQTLIEVQRPNDGSVWTDVIGN